jgi:hypothetical protein
LGFGDWESHLPYQRGLAVTQSPTKIYYSTDWSIMSVDKEDFSLDFISKVEGLSSIGISNIYYDSGSGSLIIIYADSNIDILTSDGVINVEDIKNNTGIAGDKRINDVHFFENSAFFSTGFGVVSFNLESFEFGFTTQMGFQVFSTTTTSEGILYAATEDGLYTLDLNRTFNFGDFANWEFVGEESGLPLTYEALDVAFYAGQLFLLSDNEVRRKEEGMFTSFKTAANGEEIRFLSTDGPELMIGSRFAENFISEVTFVDENLQQSKGRNCSNFINDIVMEASGRIWYADEWNGFKYSDSKESDCKTLTTISPFSHTVSDLVVEDGTLYVASGGVSDGFNFQFNRNGVYVLEEGRWENYIEQNTPIFKDEDFLNIFKIAPSPENEKIYFGSFYAGLIEANLEEKSFTLFNSTNSPIVGSQGVPFIEKVSGLAFDNNNTLWVSLYEADKPLVAITEEGSIHSFEVRSSNRLGTITVDDNGYKWIQVAGVSGGILVYDDAGTPKDPSDDRQKVINSSNSNLRTNTINSITKDLDGDMWIGTAQGPIIFTCGGALFLDENENDCIGIIKTVLEDSIAASLLVTEDVRSIAVDGGNQKWIGTRNGIFVQSPGGTDKVARFTAENSPLFDDNIIDMEFDPESGIMYIASDRGLQAYQTTTTGGFQRHRSNVYAYPNPVRPEFEGLIAFKGLPRDATIKVTDIQGQLVHEGVALGGQATWDGKDYNGRKVASGVYLVFSNSRDINLDPDTAVTKVLIVR